MPLPLLLDEMLRDHALWAAISACGELDVLRIGDRDAPPCGSNDPEVLDWAIVQARAIVTQDVSTFVAFHNQVVSGGARTPGLVVVRYGFSIPDIVESLLLVSICFEPSELSSQTWWIPFQ
jgi:hypothetical protein